MNLAILGGKPTLPQKTLPPSSLKKEEINMIAKVIEGGVLSCSGTGFFVKELENQFARFLDIKYALAVNSGTAALHTALSALGINPDEEVLVPALTFISTASVILQERAKPVFVDINPKTFNLDIIDLKKKITKKTKAIIVVHLYGCPVNMKEIFKIAQEHHLKIIEDCAQAPGAKFAGQYVGTFGDLGCFSFQQSKNLTCGEGGMIVCRDKNLFKKCRSITTHGLAGDNLQKYNYERLGYNYHLTEIQAAIAISQLKKLLRNNIKRKDKVDLYKKLLGDTGLSFQNSLEKTQSAYYCLTVLLPQKLKKKRDWFVEAVQAENAEIFKLYPLALTQTKLFGTYNKNCPIAENVASRLFNLFPWPDLSKEQIKKNVKAIKKVLNYLQ